MNILPRLALIVALVVTGCAAPPSSGSRQPAKLTAVENVESEIWFAEHSCQYRTVADRIDHCLDSRMIGAWEQANYAHGDVSHLSAADQSAGAGRVHSGRISAKAPRRDAFKAHQQRQAQRIEKVEKTVAFLVRLGQTIWEFSR